jgi:LacI family transcriptional regulator
MKDIAKDLGLSVVTVSKAMREHSDISEETRQRVLRRVQELHYSPNFTARALITGRSFMVGLIVPDLLHPFFAQVATAISKTLRKKGFCLLIASSEEDPALEVQQLEQLMAHRLDAIIIASSQSTARCFREIEQGNTPYVLIDRIIPGLSANTVTVNDETIGSLATEHLIAVGCKRVAHIRGIASSTRLGRLNGYRRALARHSLDMPAKYVVCLEEAGTQNYYQSGFKAAKRLLRMRPRPDGVFCYNDILATGAMDAILDSGLKIPDDIAVIGCGNLHYDSSLRVPLSSVDQATDLTGESAAMLAFSLIGAKTPPSPQHIVLEPHLVVRASTRRHRSKLTTLK